MKRFVIAILVLCLLAIGTIGCEKTTSSERETKITTPGGETTITIKKEVKETGEDPPPKRP